MQEAKPPRQHAAVKRLKSRDAAGIPVGKQRPPVATHSLPSVALVRRPPIVTHSLPSVAPVHRPPLGFLGLGWERLLGSPPCSWAVTSSRHHCPAEHGKAEAWPRSWRQRQVAQEPPDVVASGTSSWSSSCSLRAHGVSQPQIRPRQPQGEPRRTLGTAACAGSTGEGAAMKALCRVWWPSSRQHPGWWPSRDAPGDNTAARLKCTAPGP